MILPSPQIAIGLLLSPQIAIGLLLISIGIVVSFDIRFDALKNKN